MTIVSHKYEFIFVKTTKTAGTSIEVTLSQLCGNDDVVTPIVPPECGHRPRNYSNGDGVEYVNHMSAARIREALGDERFDSYFKFCVERHPVDKCLSHFAMKKYSADHRTWQSLFLTWRDYVEKRQFPVNHNKYTDDEGRLLVDRILKYEHLDSELEHVFREIGVPWQGLKSRAKGQYRRNVSLSPDEVSAEHRAIIMDRFAGSNRYTGYS